MGEPRIHLYALCWNEEDIIPFFLRHYGGFADRIVIHDDESDDRSVGLLRAHPKVEVVPANLPAGIGRADASRFIPFYNEAWKRSRGEADWIITCNLDEFYVHPTGLPAHLAACREQGVNIVPSFGFDMVSWRRPAPGSDLARTVRRGGRSWPMNKVCAFNPDEVEEINFTQGRHFCLPRGRLRFEPRVEVTLLHYHYLGLGRFVARYLEKKRRNPKDYPRGAPAVVAKFLWTALRSTHIAP
jgi:glycosyltransferase involved in cell wall biosynthesis